MRRVFVAQDCDTFFLHDRRMPLERGEDHLEVAVWPGGPTDEADCLEARRWFEEVYCPENGLRPEYV